MPRSALDRVRSGEWRKRRASLIVWVGTLALVADLGTTGIILTSPEYYEASPILARLAAVHVLLALAFLALIGGVILLLAAHSLGWVSRVAGALAVVHLAFPLNNLVLFATDDSLFAHLGIDVGVATALLIPAVGISTGLAWEAREFGLPRQEAAVGVGFGAVLVIANAAGL